MKKNIVSGTFIVAFLICCIGFSCTKLDTKVYDSISIFWKTEDQIAAGVAPAYSALRGYSDPFVAFTLQEATTDEMIIPNRITNWSDVGFWDALWKHTWDPNHPVILSAWQFYYRGIARINTILKILGELNPKPANLYAIEAELKTVRSFYYLQLIDLYGNVPIVEGSSTDCAQLGNKTRVEVFNFIEKELKNSLSLLNAEVNPKTYGRATKWLAYTMLAKLYLNAFVYTGTARWAETIDACNAVVNSNVYRLESDFFKNFSISNEGSRENIWSIPYDRDAGLNYFFVQGFTLHYSSGLTYGLQGGGFNGGCSTIEFLNQFSDNDIRKKMFLTGQQYINNIPDPAHMQYDGNNFPLVFDPVITSFILPLAKAEGAGARCAKWEFNREGGGLMDNDFAVYRLADIILMKAEAQLRNGNAAEALITLNTEFGDVSIRSRTGLPDFSLIDMNLDTLLAERAREFAWEGFRRNDLIRFGHFTDARIPEKAISADFRNLFPIPKAEIDKNPCLKQNPGY